MITQAEYWKEVKQLARGVCEDAYDGCDTLEDYNEQLGQMLHETIDGHQWVIYYPYNLPVLELSDNADYMVDNFGDHSVGVEFERGGLSGLHCALAFWALYADVHDEVAEITESIERRYQEETA